MAEKLTKERERVERIISQLPLVWMREELSNYITHQDKAIREFESRIHNARAEKAEAERDALKTTLEALRRKYQGLVKWFDEHEGTPCEQIRHQQEVDALKAALDQSRISFNGVRELWKQAEAELAEAQKEIAIWRLRYRDINSACGAAIDAAKDARADGLPNTEFNNKYIGDWPKDASKEEGNG